MPFHWGRTEGHIHTAESNVVEKCEGIQWWHKIYHRDSDEMAGTGQGRECKCGRRGWAWGEGGKARRRTMKTDRGRSGEPWAAEP